MLRLFHASEEPGIRLFEPRPALNPEAGVQGNAVWAIDEAHLPNYLLPRDCPRVTFAAAEKTSPEHKQKFLGTAARVIAVEETWLARINACQLYVYEFPVESFELLDAGAGYYISRATVAPLATTQITDLLSEFKRRNIEVRIQNNLWCLRNEVIASTLEFSIIRFRNAQPQEGKL